MPSGARVGRFALPAAILVACLLLPGPLGLARGAGPPTLPLADDRFFVEGLVGAELTPGSSGTISLDLHNPLGAPMTDTVLAVGIYAFNAFPGNATSGVDIASAPVLANATASGLAVNETAGALAPNATVSVSVPVQSGSATPSGTFAVRLSLRFDLNGTAYVLASRGWFTAARWATATEGPNGTTDVNLTALGVSGILPETSVLVSSSGFSYVLWGLLGGGVAVVAAGAWLYFRRANSSSGARPGPGETQAPSAFGRSRTSDGD